MSIKDEEVGEIDEEEITEELKNPNLEEPEKEKKKKKEKKPPQIFTSRIEINGKLYEQVKKDNKAYFIDKEGVYYKHQGDYFPIESDLFDKGVVILPSGIEDYGTLNELVTELKDFIHKYCDISPFFETITAYYILLSQISDKFHTINYLRVLGDFGTGKTRYLDVAGNLCYKSLMTTGTTNAPGIFRFIEQWKGTLILDEAKTKYSDEDNDITEILNTGYEKGKYIIRVDLNQQDTLGAFSSFGTKILSTRQRFQSEALESRCITEIMKDTNRKDIPITLNHDFFDKINTLRNKLLKYRFDNYNKKYTLSSEQINKIDINNRLKQSLSAFFILLSETDVYDDFVEFAKKYNREIIKVSASSYEGIIVTSFFIELEKKIDEWKIKVIKVIKDINVEEGIKNIERESSTTNRLETLLLFLNNLNNLNNLNSSSEKSKDFAIKTSDLLPYIHQEGSEKASAVSIGKRLTTLGFTRTRKTIKGVSIQALDLNLEHLTKIFRKYIPGDVESKSEPEEEINVDALLEKPVSEPEKTGEQIEEDERDNNEFEKHVEELDGYVDEQLSENGKHISELLQDDKKYYGENEGGEDQE